MPNLTLAISEEIRRKMAMFPEINWSEVARQAITEKTRIMERAQQLLAKSSLTEKGAVLLGADAKRKVWKRHLKR
ncbi:MAG: hypothetical protein ACYCPQ_09315 [Elusimicrobiota bacterium]